MTLVPTFTDQAAGDAYEATLSEHAKLVCIGGTFAINCAIAFGVSDSERVLFAPDKVKLLEWLREGYLRGEWGPKPGSDAAHFMALAEHFAGGKPRSDQRQAVMKACLAHQLSIMRRGKTSSMASGTQVNDPKRQAALDQLREIENWDNPTMPEDEGGK